eukprot:TRINITY_DN193_c2_g3_i1.p1 TRINITY_DN193_c2_g3~~TRINITY_DN193_c2_g3_i1.p1  ORF type:complete len:4156 (+),score=1253.07 TRINITY_DN193_c2_g3_i1:1716-12470(+)
MWGESRHAAEELMSSPVADQKAGITDLGPADGFSSIATMLATLPPMPNDEEREYKVCMYTSFVSPDWTGQRKAWVEVQQASGYTGQLQINNVYTGLPSFQTQPSFVRHWTLASALTPHTNQIIGADTRSVGIGGAATSYLADPAQGTTSTLGFQLVSFGGRGDPHLTSLARFKLVRLTAPLNDMPGDSSDTSWGDQSTWLTEGAIDCSRAGVETNLAACDAPLGLLPGGATCPSVSDVIANRMGVNFQIPLQPGKYIFCFMVQSLGMSQLQPWQVLRQDPAAGGSMYLYSHPSFLQFQPGPAVTWTTSALVDKVSALNMTVFDLRTQTIPVNASDPNNTQTRVVSLSGWCARAANQVVGEGVQCRSINQASQSAFFSGARYYTDLFTVVNDTQVCPTPFSPPDGVGSAGVQRWWRMIRTANSSTMIEALLTDTETSRFQLPPVEPTPTSRYKMCVFKAGQASNYEATGWVAKAGVTYQLSMACIGLPPGTPCSPTGAWAPSRAMDPNAPVPFDLKPQVSVAYNSSLRFVSFDPVATQGLYELQVPPAMVTTPSGFFTRTPVVISGEIVTFTVSVGAHDGSFYPFDTYAVDVYRCQAPGTGNWGQLACTTSVTPPLRHADSLEEDDRDAEALQSSAAFDIVNVDTTGACVPANAANYGWPSSGLRQFTNTGVATFQIRYLSGCGTLGAEFGCGLKFRGVASDGTVLESLPQWINVEYQYPASVGLGSTRTNVQAMTPEIAAPAAGSCTPPECFMTTCVHRAECPLYIQAMQFRGTYEYAALGSVTIVYSEQDLPANVGISPLQNNWNSNWQRGGYALYRQTPRLLTGFDVGYSYLNVSYEVNGVNSSWVRAVIEVIRPTPTALNPTSLRPIDVWSQAIRDTRIEPAPRWLGSVMTGGVMAADPGSYVQALVPYELRYGVMGGNTTVTPQIGITGCVMESVNVPGGNQVLAVMEDGAGQATANNMRTQSVLDTPRFGGSPRSDGAGWYLRFRMLNNVGCSRFTGGCAITFGLRKTASSVGSGVEMVVQTPVRVPGTSLEIWSNPGLGNASRTGQSNSVTAREGFLISAFPGTPCGSGCFHYDEFHYGDVFALIAGPSPADGIFNRDQVTARANPFATNCAYFGAGGCKVEAYAPRIINGDMWGAQWLMKANKPCLQCDFTFHSTWGAGPYSYTKGTSFSGLEFYGTRTLSFRDEPLFLDCSVLAVSTVTGGVNWPFNSTQSNLFTINVQATATLATDSTGLSITAAAEWPQWQVVLDTANDVTPATPGAYTLSQTGTGRSILISQMGAAGSPSVASFSNLYFAPGPTATGRGPTSTTDNVAVTFRAVGYKYSQTGTGSLPEQRVSLSCTVDVQLVPDVAPTTVKVLEVTSAVGATRGCLLDQAAQPSCLQWYSNVAQVQPDAAGVAQTVFTVRVRSGTSAATLARDLSARGITVVPADTVGVDPSVSEIFLPFGADGTATTAVDIPSFYPDTTVGNATLGSDATYTFGKVGLKFWRSSYSPVSGEATLGIAYSSGALGTLTTNLPVRDARFRICATRTTAGVETLEDNGDPLFKLCSTLRLWVLPDVTNKKLGLIDVPPAGVKVPGIGSTCGGSADLLTFSAVPYVEYPQSSTLRFVVYDISVQYTLSLGTQTLASAASSATNRSMTVSGVVSAGLPEAARVTHGGQIAPLSVVQGTFNVYGLHEMPTAAEARVQASNADDPADVIASVFTLETYSFERTPEIYESFQVLDTVQYDDECPTKRMLSERSDGYRSYTPNTPPGLGWNYSAGAAVGLPFPIQVAVTTQAKNRAWTYASEHPTTPGSGLVSVQLSSATGCNNGGKLTVWTLAPSTSADTQVVRNGTYSGISWAYRGTGGALVTGSPTSITAHTVYINQGVATAWPIFTQPCESCILRMELCYMSATTHTDCLASLGTSKSDQLPIFAERSKVTKPFTVRPYRSTDLQIYAQTLPAERTPREIMVGQTFAIWYEAAKVFGGRWTMAPAGTSSVLSISVDTVFTLPTGAGQAKYGNGGWLQSDDADSEIPPSTLSVAGDCVPVIAQKLMSAAVTSVVSTRSPGMTTFYFTRPCAACSIKVMYSGCTGSTCRLNALEGAQWRSFMMQRYTTPIRSGNGALRPVLTYRVVTCATAWAWAGVGPQPAVRKQQPFSLTAWRVDRNGFPSWEGAQAVAFTPSELNAGNGAGGEVLVTSPVTRLARTQARGGSATVRVATTRACWKCSAEFAGMGTNNAQLTVDYTVLTDATQVLVSPAPGEPRTRVYVPDWWPGGAAAAGGSVTTSNTTGQWSFEVYAADELGDRSYTVAGPTVTAFMPLWAERKTASSLVSLVEKGVTLGGVETLGGSVVAGTPRVFVDSGITAASDGIASSASVVAGTTAFNGVPFDIGGTLPAGMTTVKIDGVSANYPIGFSMGGALPTRAFGSTDTVSVDLTTMADRLAVDNLASTYVCVDMYEGASCTFNAYAVGPIVQNNPTEFFVSTAPVNYGNARAEWTCDAGCEIEVTRSSVFRRGVAQMGIRFLRAAGSTATQCACAVTVTAPNLLNATAQTVTVSYQRSAPAKWQWAGTDRLVNPLPQGSTLSTTESVPARLISVRLIAVDSLDRPVGVQQEDVSAIYGNPSAPQGSVEAGCGFQGCVFSRTGMTPANCFRQQGQPIVSADGMVIDVAGWFAPGAKCLIGRDAVNPAFTGFVGLPIEADLEVTLVTPVAAEIFPHQGLGLDRPFFSGLTSSVGTNAAAVVGAGATISFRVVDADNNTVAGDFHSVFTITSVAGTGNAPDGTAGGVYTVSGRTKNGIATLEIEPGYPTLIPTTGMHNPWNFTVAPAYYLVNDTFIFSFIQTEWMWPTSYLGRKAPTSVGPLYIVRQATALQVEVTLGSAPMPSRVPCLSCAGSCEDDPIGMLTPFGGCQAVMQLGGNMSGCGASVQDIVPALTNTIIGDPTSSMAHLYASSPLMKVCPQTCGLCAAGEFTPTVYWLSGYPFGMTVRAVDHEGNQVTAVDERGSEANVVFRPMSTPCIAADRTAEQDWLPQGCDVPYQATGAGGQSGALCEPKTIPALPDCMTSNWETAPSATAVGEPFPEELELTAGKWSKPIVRYTGTRTGAVKFMLTTFDLGTDKGNMRCDTKGGGCTPTQLDLGFDSPYTFVGEIRLQQMAHLQLAGTGITCVYPDSGDLDYCNLPGNWGPNQNGVVYRGQRFQMAIDIIDTEALRVRGESFSEIFLSAECAGVGLALLGTVGPTGDITIGSVPTVGVTGGRTLFSDLVVNYTCTETYLVFGCTAPSTIKLDNNCNKLRGLRVGPFAVQLSPGEPPLPIPVPPPIVTVSLTVMSWPPMILSEAKATFDTYIADTFNDAGAKQFAGAMADMLKGSVPGVQKLELTRVCQIEDSQKSSPIPDQCYAGQSMNVPFGQAGYGCSCNLFGHTGIPSAAPTINTNIVVTFAPVSTTAAARRLLQTDPPISTAANAFADVTLDASAAGIDPTELTNRIAKAIADDLNSPNSKLKANGGAGFANADPNSVSASTPATPAPAPPGTPTPGLVTPTPPVATLRPTDGVPRPTFSPATSSPSSGPITASPSDAPATAPGLLSAALLAALTLLAF